MSSTTQICRTKLTQKCGEQCEKSFNSRISSKISNAFMACMANIQPYSKFQYPLMQYWFQYKAFI